MALKARSRDRKIPEVNLIPMLNVMMGILAFFVMITMTLTEEQGVEVQLPGDPEQAPPADSEPPPVLVVQLTEQGFLQVEGETMTMDDLRPQLRLFLQRDEEAIVVLEANEQLSYERVLQALADLKAIGGDRISLAID